MNAAKRTLLAILGVLLFASFANASVTCQSRDSSIFPVNEKGIKIGGFGFESKSECDQLVAKSAQGPFVCAWTGKAYGLFNSSTGMRYGPSDDGWHWGDADQCIHAAVSQAAPSSAVCTWNGKHYIPYSRAKNTPLSETSSGWENFDECVSQAVKTATSSAVCGWGPNDYLFTLEGTQIPYKFMSTPSCNSFLNVFKNNPLFSQMISVLAKKNDLDFAATPIANGTPDGKVGFANWKKCEVAADAYHLTKNAGGVLSPECRPDTLYSWGGFDKYEWFKKNMADGQAWTTPLIKSLFTTESAAGTFGYGPIPLRFKIKSTVAFKRVDENGNTCEAIVSSGQGTKAEFDHTIYQRVVLRSTGLSFVDFIICSPHVVSSWSAATREGYDEVMRDYKWMTTQNYFLWEAYSKQKGVDDFIGNTIDSAQTDFSQSSFNIRMNMLKALAVANEGYIAAEKGQTKADHFATRWPIYFNPN